MKGDIGRIFRKYNIKTVYEPPRRKPNLVRNRKVGIKLENQGVHIMKWAIKLTATGTSKNTTEKRTQWNHLTEINISLWKLLIPISGPYHPI